LCILQADISIHKADPLYVTLTVFCRMQSFGSRETERNVSYIGAREMALNSSEKERSDVIAAVRSVSSIYELLLDLIVYYTLDTDTEWHSGKVLDLQSIVCGFSSHEDKAE